MHNDGNLKIHFLHSTTSH